MSKKNLNIPIGAVGNFTKNAIENFEENLIKEENFLEKTGSINKSVKSKDK